MKTQHGDVTLKPPKKEPYVKLPLLIMQRADLTPAAKLVFAVIADRVGNNGRAWPGIRRIGGDCGITRRTVIKAITQLESRGLLIVDRGNNGQRNRYKLGKSGAKIIPVCKKKSGAKITPGGVKNTPEAVQKIHQNLLRTSLRTKLAQKRSRFVKPTPEEVAEYAKAIGYDLNGTRFIDYYESIGWKVGKNAMKDWRATVRGWREREKGKTDTPAAATPTDTRCSCGAQGVLQAEDGWRCMACIGAAGRKAGQN